MPIYLVVDQTAEIDSPARNRLVIAARPASAARHVVEDRFAVSMPSPLDMHRLGGLGIVIETAGDVGDDADGQAPGTAAQTEQPNAEQVPQGGGTVQGVTSSMPEGWHVEAAGADGAQADDELDPDRLREDRGERRSIVDELDEDNDGKLTDEQFAGAQ